MSGAGPRTGRLSYGAAGVALALVGVLAFSLKAIVVKLIYRHGVDPVTLLALRMAFALPVFVGAAWWAGRGAAAPPLHARELALIGALGVLGYYAGSLLDFMGLQYVSAALGRLVLFLYPTVVVVLSAAFLRTPVTARIATALAVCYAGIALVLSRAWTESQGDVALGAALIFGSAIAYSVYLVWGSRVVARVGSMRFTAWAMSGATAVCVGHFLAARPLAAIVLPAEVYALVLLLATACTALPVFATAEALKRVGANLVAILGSAGPVATIALGFIILGETMTPAQLAGALLVIGGVLLVTVRPAR
ncbi:MAG: DMT family transporter [Burkholderiales bacterium]|nr:DMT family transporter [Burkholderiales bacterium]